jgi:multiple sugar transport system ATP-binding protein
VAGFIGSPAMNFLSGRIAPNGMAVFETDSGRTLPLPPQLDPSAKGRRAICGIRPEDLTLAEGGLPAEVVIIEPTGSEIQVMARIDGQPVVAVFRERHLFKPGEMMSLLPQARSMHLFDAETGRRL